MNFIIRLCLLLFSVAGLIYDDLQLDGLCQQNTYQCQRACFCYDTKDPIVNTCNPENLAYQCQCHQNYFPQTRNTSFAAFYGKCTSNLLDCRDTCGSDATCFNRCDEANKCLPENDHDDPCFWGDRKVKVPTDVTPKTRKPSIFDEPEPSNAFVISSSLYLVVFVSTLALLTAQL